MQSGRTDAEWEAALLYLRFNIWLAPHLIRTNIDKIPNQISHLGATKTFTAANQRWQKI